MGNWIQWIGNCSYSQKPFWNWINSFDILVLVLLGRWKTIRTTWLLSFCSFCFSQLVFPCYQGESTPQVAKSPQIPCQAINHPPIRNSLELRDSTQYCGEQLLPEKLEYKVLRSACQVKEEVKAICCRPRLRGRRAKMTTYMQVYQCVLS